MCFKTRVRVCALSLVAGAVFMAGPETRAQVELPEPYKSTVEQTWANSAARRAVIRQQATTVTTVWPGKDVPNWGDIMWALANLHENKNVQAVNDRLLYHTTQPVPYAYFALPDYTRMLMQYGSHGTVAPGRINPTTESAMLEALWDLAGEGIPHPDQGGRGSVLADALPSRLWWVDGSENHDLIRKSTYYLSSYLFMNHPDFANRKYVESNLVPVDKRKTAAEHFAAWDDYYEQWLPSRATMGLFIETGSSTYQKYSTAALLNLVDVAPNETIRQRAKMMMDIFLIEEEQFSFNGVRGGGLSRTEQVLDNGFGKNIKPLLYGEGGNATHTKVFETSDYQVPEIAALIHNADREEPQEMWTRLPGQYLARRYGGEVIQLEPNSHLVNYAYRTRNYMMGTVLQDPKIEYYGASGQERRSGILLDDAQAVYVDPQIDRSGVRHVDAFWAYQHKAAMIGQKMVKASLTSDMRLFLTSGLDPIEQDDWLFMEHADAFVGVHVLDGGYNWVTATDTRYAGQYMVFENEWSPFIMQAGDRDTYADLQAFMTAVLGAQINVLADRIEYTPPGEQSTMTFFLNDAALPQLDGQPVNLTPTFAYNGPYLQGDWGDPIVTARYDNVITTYDFTNNTITTTVLPEPGSMALLALGALAVAHLRRRPAKE